MNPGKNRCLPIILLFLSVAGGASAQNFAIDWFTIDGGGGTSTGGGYTVSGTIGQPDAGTMSGGTYSLDGGFWGIYAVQTLGSPFLAINRSATNTIVISWPSSTANLFILQENAIALNSVNWSNSPATIQNDGTSKSV